MIEAELIKNIEDSLVIIFLFNILWVILLFSFVGNIKNKLFNEITKHLTKEIYKAFNKANSKYKNK